MSYQKGYQLENKVMNQYRMKGWVSFRSAGSHSPIDVIAINGMGPTRLIHFIQCKKGKLSKNKEQALIDFGKAFNGTYQGEFHLVRSRSNKKRMVKS